MDGWLVVIVIFIFIVIFVALYFFVFRKRGDPDPDPTPPTPAPPTPTPPEPPGSSVWSDNITVGSLKLTQLISTLKTSISSVLIGKPYLYSQSDAAVVSSVLSVILVPWSYPDSFSDLTYVKVGSNQIVGLKVANQSVVYDSTFFKSAFSLSSSDKTVVPLIANGKKSSVSSKDWIVLMTDSSPPQSALIASASASPTSGTNYIVGNNKVITAYSSILAVADAVINNTAPTSASDQTRAKYRRITDVIFRSTALSICVTMGCAVIATDNTNTTLIPCSCTQALRMSTPQPYNLASVTLAPAAQQNILYSIISYDRAVNYGVAGSVTGSVTITVNKKTYNAIQIINQSNTYFIQWSSLAFSGNIVSSGPYWLAMITLNNIIEPAVLS